MTTPTDTAKLADEIEALRKRADDQGNEDWGGTNAARHRLHTVLTNNAPAIVSALRERDALQEEVERLRAQDWQPIETAPPKYGEPSLLLCGWPEQRSVRIGERNNNGAVDYYWIYGAMGGEIASGSYIGTPTHWMPLPAPPLTTAPSPATQPQSK